MSEFEDKMAETILSELKDRVIGEFEEQAKNLIQFEQIKPDGTKITVTKSVHNMFKTIFTLVNRNIPVMLVGSAGSGKSTCAQQIAESLDIDFYFSNAITQEYKLTGFIDATGKYHETQFYKAFKNGGLFLLDEVDASIPETLIILNNAISNGYFDFPTGKIEAHEDFRVIACANTYGTGLDSTYVGRNQLDGATLDRFVPFVFDYDMALERQLTDNIKWCECVQKIRDRVREKGLNHIISTRAIVYGSELIKCKISTPQIIRSIIFKNLGEDDIRYLEKIPANGNKYLQVYNELVTVEED